MLPPTKFKNLAVSHLGLMFNQLSASATLGPFVVGSQSHSIKLAALDLYHDQGSHSAADCATAVAAAYGIELEALLKEYEFLVESRPKHKDVVLWYVQCTFSWVPSVGALWALDAIAMRTCGGVPKGELRVGLNFNGLHFYGTKSGREVEVTHNIEHMAGPRVAHDADGETIMYYLLVGAGTVAIRTSMAFDLVQLLEDYQVALGVPKYPHDLPDAVGSSPHALQWQTPHNCAIPSAFGIHGVHLTDADPAAAQFLTSQVSAARDAAIKALDLMIDEQQSGGDCEASVGPADPAVCSMRTCLHRVAALVLQWARQSMRMGWVRWCKLLVHKPLQEAAAPHTHPNSSQGVALWRRSLGAVLVQWRRHLLRQGWMVWHHRFAVLRLLEAASETAIHQIEQQAQKEVEEIETQRSIHEKEQKAKMRVLMSKIKELKPKANGA